MTGIFVVIEMQVAEMFFEVAVMSSDPSRVVYLDLVTPLGPGPVLYVFTDWSVETPPESMFTVPATCSQYPIGACTADHAHNTFLTHSIAQAMSLFN